MKNQYVVNSVLEVSNIMNNNDFQSIFLLKALLFEIITKKECMNENERNKFVREEIQAIYEEFDSCYKKLSLIKQFLYDVNKVANGEEPSYELNEASEAEKEVYNL